MRSVQEHQDVIAGLIGPRPAVAVAPGEALGLVLAADVVAPVSLPGFDNSAMDGFAVLAADIAGTGSPIVNRPDLIRDPNVSHPTNSRFFDPAAFRVSDANRLGEQRGIRERGRRSIRHTPLITRTFSRPLTARHGSSTLRRCRSAQPGRFVHHRTRRPSKRPCSAPVVGSPSA